MITIEPEDNVQVYYTQILYIFTCSVHPWWSGGEFPFFVEFGGNGSTVEIETNEIYSLLTTNYHTRVEFMIPSSDVVQIGCSAPVLNPETPDWWIRASIPVQVVGMTLEINSRVRR